jgi:hypothetical protein
MCGAGRAPRKMRATSRREVNTNCVGTSIMCCGSYVSRATCYIENSIAGLQMNSIEEVGNAPFSYFPEIAMVHEG